jgi:hypothetical protein
MRKLIPLLLSLLLLLSLIPGIFAADSQADPVPASEPAELLDPKVETMIAWALETAADDAHGYSQSDRFGPNYDCASFVCTALREGGFDVDVRLSPTALVNELPAYGFRVYRRGETEPQRGDILVKTYTHVEICMGGRDCVGAHQNYDGRSGDRSGREIEYRTEDSSFECPFCYKEQYNYILRYVPPVSPADLPTAERIIPCET